MVPQTQKSTTDTHREKEIQITLKIIIKREEKARINKRITKTTPKQ